MDVEHKLLDAAQIDSILTKLGKIITRCGLEAHAFKVGSFLFYVCFCASLLFCRTTEACQIAMYARSKHSNSGCVHMQRDENKISYM